MRDRKALVSVLTLFSLLAGLLEARAQTVAVTVDDLPFVAGNLKTKDSSNRRATQVNKRILGTLARHQVPATGFVVQEQVEHLGRTGRRILRQWLQPGFDLGNHLYSHPDVNTLSAGQVEREIVRGESQLVPLLRTVARKPAFLRFPYNHTGDTRDKHDTVSAFLADRGYRLAPCTIENDDYAFNAAYIVARARRDRPTAARIRASYIAYTGAKIDWYTALHRQLFGYEPPHIMLLHDNLLNADTLDEVLAEFQRRGYRFVNLADALQDRAYSVPENVTPYGPMWAYRWARELGIKLDGRNEPEPPAWIDQYVKEKGVS